LLVVLQGISQRKHMISCRLLYIVVTGLLFFGARAKQKNNFKQTKNTNTQGTVCKYHVCLQAKHLYNA
uniref:hypothetical protein n=1 Tax=Salmonella sp. s60732 TaxID=3160132 RepID=UPI003754267E